MIIFKQNSITGITEFISINQNNKLLFKLHGITFLVACDITEELRRLYKFAYNKAISDIESKLYEFKLD